MRKFLVVIWLIFGGLAIVKAQNGKVHYIANEGVLIETENRKVLIDGLFDSFYKDYLSPSEEVINLMFEGKSPFGKVDLVLATHVHRDHFEAKLTGEFLVNHHESLFKSSKQVTDTLKTNFLSFDKIASRVEGKVKGTQIIEDELEGLKLYSFFINHSGGERMKDIVNMGYVIEVDGVKVLHLGDAEMDIERFAALDLASYDIDIALVPYWYVLNEAGTTIINEHIKAKKVVGIHFPAAPSPLALKEIKKEFPDLQVFLKYGEVAEF